MHFQAGQPRSRPQTQGDIRNHWVAETVRAVLEASLQFQSQSAEHSFLVRVKRLCYLLKKLLTFKIPNQFDEQSTSNDRRRVKHERTIIIVNGHTKHCRVVNTKRLCVDKLSDGFPKRPFAGGFQMKPERRLLRLKL